MATNRPNPQIIPWPNDPKFWAFRRLDLGHIVGPFRSAKEAERGLRRELEKGNPHREI
jgi:hypothetical protein